MAKYNVKTQSLTLTEIIRKYHFISDACGEDLGNISVEKVFQPHEKIVVQGEMANSLVLLAEGYTRVTFHKGEKEDTICFGSCGDLFASFHSLWTNAPSAFGLEALTEAKCYLIPYRKFRWLEEKYPDLTHWLCIVLIEQMYSFEVLYRKMSMSSPEERLASFMDFSADKLPTITPAELTNVVPLKLIAQYLGMTPQTLSKVRRKYVGR